MSDIRPISKKALIVLFTSIPAAILLVTLLFVIFGGQRPMHMEMPPQAVVLDTVVAEDITESSEYVALVEADNIVDLRARVSGFLVAKNFNDGDTVSKGQLLFQIEPDQYQALLESAEADVISTQAQLGLATVDFNRISDLYTRNTAPKSDYDKSKSAFEVAQAAVMRAKAARNLAKLNLDYTAIGAPFDGQINDTPFNVGSLLGPDSGVLATVVSVDPILVTFGISDKIIASAHQNGASKRNELDQWQVRLKIGNTFYDQIGTFTYIAPMVDPKTDTIKFKAKFINPDKTLRPGQIVTAVVERTSPQRRLVVPKEAVLTDVNGNYVLMAQEVPADPKDPNSKGGLVSEMRRVTIGGSASDTTFILEDGLKEGEKFIRQGLMSNGATLTPGAPIQIAAPPAAPENVDQGAAPSQDDMSQKHQEQKAETEGSE